MLLSEEIEFCTTGALDTMVAMAIITNFRKYYCLETIVNKKISNVTKFSILLSKGIQKKLTAW